jgi:large subunit ribosomal protein L40e
MTPPVGTVGKRLAQDIFEPPALGLKPQGDSTLPITDVYKKQLAQAHRLHYKVCRNCGARNAKAATYCRKCRGHNLRWKKRELGAK